MPEVYPEQREGTVLLIAKRRVLRTCNLLEVQPQGTELLISNKNKFLSRKRRVCKPLAYRCDHLEALTKHLIHGCYLVTSKKHICTTCAHTHTRTHTHTHTQTHTHARTHTYIVGKECQAYDIIISTNFFDTIQVSHIKYL